MEFDRTSLCEKVEKNSTPEYVSRSGWTWKLILASISTTIGLAVPVGYVTGVVNTPSEIIKIWCNESVYSQYNIVLDHSQIDTIWSLIVSIFLIGGMIGSLSGSWVADRVGRKSGLMISVILYSISALMFIISKPMYSVEILLLARFLSGISSGLVTSIMPMYLMELAPVSIRGTVGVLCPLGCVIGVPTSQALGLNMILGNENNWHYLFGIYLIFVLFTGACLPLLPESPKYLFAIRGLRQKAIKELANLRQLPEQQVVGELDEKIDQETEVWSVIKVISNRSLRIKLLLVCALHGGQQLSGINAVFFYSGRIFETAGLPQVYAQYASLGAGTVNLIAAITMLMFVNSFPRRVLTIASSFLSSVFIIILSLSITYTKTFTWMTYIATFSIFGYLIAFQIGLSPIPLFIGSELFSMGPKPAAMALGSVTNWGCNFLVGMTFLELNNRFGAHSFLLFAACTMSLAIFLYACLPETNGNIKTKKHIKK